MAFALTGVDCNACWRALPFAVVVHGARRRHSRARTPRRGARAYLTFEGGIDLPPVLGSRSTHISGGLGGLEGRAFTGRRYVPISRTRTNRRTFRFTAAEPPEVQSPALACCR